MRFYILHTQSLRGIIDNLYIVGQTPNVIKPYLTIDTQNAFKRDVVYVLEISYFIIQIFEISKTSNSRQCHVYTEIRSQFEGVLSPIIILQRQLSICFISHSYKLYVCSFVDFGMKRMDRCHHSRIIGLCALKLRWKFCVNMVIATF